MNGTTTKEPHRLARTTFQTSRLLDFCSEKELTAQTGHGKKDWPVVIVKELLDNALDAAEEAGIAPRVTVTVDAKHIQVADNGPGLPVSTLKGILDFSVRVSSREAYVSPTRGAQGNALKTLVMMPMVLDGQCGRVEIAATGQRHEITCQVDRIGQTPEVTSHSTPDDFVKTGTRITLTWPDSACSILKDAGPRILQIAEAYTFLNPHLTLELTCLGESRHIAATDPQWTKWRPSDPTSPHWYQREHLSRLIGAYLTEDRRKQREERLVREFITEFRGLTGTAKQKAILNQTGFDRMPLSVLINGHDLDAAKVGMLLTAMQQHSKPVKPAALGIIGEDHLRRRCEEQGCVMETFSYVKKMGERDGLPFVIETAFAALTPSDDSTTPRTRRFVTGVNWAVGILNPFRQLGVGESLDTFLEQFRASHREPVVLLLHLARPRIAYADRGKSSVVLEEPAREEDDVDGR